MASEEHKIEKYLTKEIKKLNGICYKWTSPGRNGVFDRIIIFPNKIFFVEVKTKEGKLSVRQIREKKLLSSYIGGVFVLYGLNDVTTFINGLKKRYINV